MSGPLAPQQLCLVRQGYNEVMLTAYIRAAMRHAHYEILDGEQPFYGEIPECQGVWAAAATLEQLASHS